MNHVILVITALLVYVTSSIGQAPNIVLIFTDDQGWNDVGCYGSEIPTPNMDLLAQEGIKLNHFYSASSICTPSRFGLLTGLNPSRSKDELLGALMFLNDKERGIQQGETTIAEILRDKGGYETALIGKWHLGHGNTDFLPPNHGFDHFRGHTGGCIDYFTMTYGSIPDWYHGLEHFQQDGYATELITSEAVDYIWSKKDNNQPFFLYLPFNAPHYGKGYSPGKDEPINIMQPQAADLKRVSSIPDKVRREFAAMTVNLDDGIGKIMQALDETGLSANTLVVFLTDHGGDPVYGGSNLPLRGVKATLFEGGIRVPAIMKWPEKIAAGTTSDALMWSIDLFPTFCKLANIDTRDIDLDGLDISSTLLDEGSTGSREMFWELAGHQELDRLPWGALRQDNWKFVQSPEDGNFLFDLSVDPLEKDNLAEDDIDKLESMKQRWQDLAKQYRE